MLPGIQNNQAPKKVLLVGNKKLAGLNGHIDGDLNVRECGSLVEAVKLAAETNYAAVLLIPEAFGPALGSAASTIKKANPATEIILLVQAYQEPFAIEMMENNRTLIADYAVAPVNQGRLRAMILKEQLLKQNSNRQDKKSADSELIEQLSKLATEDELTGLKNRRYVREFVRQIIERAQVENIRLTLFFFDVDDFKHYNDVYGHATGDEILKQTAIIMRRSCRKHDVVGRIGGDEFAVVFWDNPKEGDIDEERRNAQADHPKQIFFLAERFRKQMHQAHLNAIGPEGKGTLTISGGLAGYPRDGKTVDELFDRADKALYEAKRAGKNAIYLVGEPQA